MAYLGETPVPLHQSPYQDYSPVDLAMELIKCYGQIDGAHHKTWVLDQVARCLKGCPIVNLRVAKWDDRPDEFRFEIGENAAYLEWVEAMKGGVDAESENGREYDYDDGIAP